MKNACSVMWDGGDAGGRRAVRVVSGDGSIDVRCANHANPRGNLEDAVAMHKAASEAREAGKARREVR